MDSVTKTYVDQLAKELTRYRRLRSQVTDAVGRPEFHDTAEEWDRQAHRVAGAAEGLQAALERTEMREPWCNHDPVAIGPDGVCECGVHVQRESAAELLQWVWCAHNNDLGDWCPWSGLLTGGEAECPAGCHPATAYRVLR